MGRAWCWESEDLSSSCARAEIHPPSHAISSASSCLSCPPSGLSGRRSQRGRWGRGREARAEGQDRERIQGNVSSQGCLQAAVNGSVQAPVRAEWDVGARGRNTGWLERAHCGRLGVLATGQVNRLGKLPPWWGQEVTNGWPLHNLWLSWGQEDELGLSNGLATLPAPAPYPPC